MGSGLRTFVVVNPASANGRTGREWPVLQTRLSEVLEDWRFGLTGGPMGTPESAQALTRRALRDGFEMIVAIGGDGTNNEVVNGFFEDGIPINREAVFGHIPKGTGGDFRKTLGLLGSAEEIRRRAVDRLRGRAAQPIDVGHMTLIDSQDHAMVRHFINIASFGLGGEVDAYVNASSKALGGRLSFLRAALRATLHYRPYPVDLKIDGRPAERRSIFNVAVANGQFFGGGMHVAPDARLDDGWFDVVTIQARGLADVLALSRPLYRGTHTRLPNVEVIRARTVEADSPHRVLLDVDGEQPGRLPATFTLMPGALRLKVSD